MGTIQPNACGGDHGRVCRRLRGPSARLGDGQLSVGHVRPCDMTTTRSTTTRLTPAGALVWALLAVAGPAQAHAGTEPGLIGDVSSSRWFSPGGDGSKDTVRVGIHTTDPARITVTVRHERLGWVARRVTLRDTRSTTRAWAWNGRNDRGRVVVDGNYVVTVEARGRSGTGRATTRVKSRRHYTARSVGSPELTLDRTTVASGDPVSFTARQVLESRTAFGRDRLRPVLTAVTVYADSAGAAVAASFPVEADVSGPARVWTPSSPGTYSVVAHFVDHYGNSGTAARRVTVTP